MALARLIHEFKLFVLRHVAVHAERMRATLALLGMESRLQRVSIDDDAYHRVRIGPTSDLNELNRYRRQLWDAEIEVMLIKVPN